MPNSFHTIVFKDTDPGVAYSLLASIVVPRPIALVSTISKDGIANLAPFSFFMVGGSNPPSVAFSPTLSSKATEKDSVRNIRESGEFVVNLVDRPMVDGMNSTSKSYGPDESEWEHSGFHPVGSDSVRPDRVKESLVSLECRLFTIVEHGNAALSARYVIGEVIRMHLDERLYAGSALDTTRFQPVARLGGAQYLDLSGPEVFDLKRP